MCVWALQLRRFSGLIKGALPADWATPPTVQGHMALEWIYDRCNSTILAQGGGQKCPPPHTVNHREFCWCAHLSRSHMVLKWRYMACGLHLQAWPLVLVLSSAQAMAGSCKRDAPLSGHLEHCSQGDIHQTASLLTGCKRLCREALHASSTTAVIQTATQKSSAWMASSTSRYTQSESSSPMRNSSMTTR